MSSLLPKEFVGWVDWAEAHLVQEIEAQPENACRGMSVTEPEPELRAIFVEGLKTSKTFDRGVDAAEKVIYFFNSANIRVAIGYAFSRADRRPRERQFNIVVVTHRKLSNLVKNGNAMLYSVADIPSENIDAIYAFDPQQTKFRRIK
jgi:hypothetical protein